VATVAASMSEKDVLRESERATWNAAGNTRLETCCARRQPRHPRRNVREQPSNFTTKHYEIEGGHGSSHQRPSKSETRRAPYPGTVDYCLPNTREPQRVATLSTQSSERFGSIPKPYLRQSQPLNFLSPTNEMQSPGSDGDQSLDGRLPNPDLLSLHSARTDAHA
jgi:hypothetical protein